MNEKICVVMVGPPFSGKTTLANKKYPDYIIISRDAIRMELFGKNYKQNGQKEGRVTQKFNALLKKNYGKKIVIDNCNCGEKYLENIIEKLAGYEFKYELLETSLSTLYIRSIISKIKGNKFIPFKVLKNLKEKCEEIKKLFLWQD